jgi:hypothetical protein
MTGSCQKTEAVARLETSYWQRQLPELRKNGADHFSRLSGSNMIAVLNFFHHHFSENYRNEANIFI